MVDGFQKYVLMHKDVPVAQIELDNASGSVSAIGAVYAPAHMPVGVFTDKGVSCRAALIYKLPKTKEM